MIVQRTCLSSDACHDLIALEIDDDIIAAFIYQSTSYAANFSFQFALLGT